MAVDQRCWTGREHGALEEGAYGSADSTGAIDGMSCDRFVGLIAGKPLLYHMAYRRSFAVAAAIMLPITRTMASTPTSGPRGRKLETIRLLCSWYRSRKSHNGAVDRLEDAQSRAVERLMI